MFELILFKNDKKEINVIVMVVVYVYHTKKYNWKIVNYYAIHYSQTNLNGYF